MMVNFSDDEGGPLYGDLRPPPSQRARWRRLALRLAAVVLGISAGWVIVAAVASITGSAAPLVLGWSIVAGGLVWRIEQEARG